MKIIGIDPGLNGAIAILEDNKVKTMFEMPVMSEGKKNKRQLNSAQLVKLIKDNIDNIEETVIIVEQVNAMPGQGVLYELDGVPEDVAREAFRLAGHKLPVGTRFLRRNDEVL